MRVVQCWDDGVSSDVQLVKIFRRHGAKASFNTIIGTEHPFPPEDPMAYHPSCHVLADDFWARYERAKSGGVFYFWGHSYEFVTAGMWAECEAKIARISSDPETAWGNVADLFMGADMFRETEEA